MGAKQSVKIRSLSEKGDANELKKMIKKAGSKLTTEVLDTPGSDGSTAFLLGAKNGHAEVVKLLLEHGANPYSLDMAQESGITYAASEGHQECLVAMKESGKVDFNHSPLPIIAAIQVGGLDTTKWLLENGANPSQLNEDGEGALVHAVVKQNQEIVQLLIDHKVDVDTGAIKPYARFPLHAAVSRLYHDKKCMTMLVDAGANVNNVDEENWSSLHQAVSDAAARAGGCRNTSRPTDIIGYLVDHGADPKLKSKDGKTPKDLANDQFDDENIIHAMLNHEVVDLKQESAVWDSVNKQKG